MNKEEKEEFNKLIDKLLKCTTEDDTFKYLKMILKGYNLSHYKDLVLSNPFYKSLIPEIRDEILENITDIRKSIEIEIQEIDNALTKMLKEDNQLEKINELKGLKRDCISLIFSIDERKKDLLSII